MSASAAFLAPRLPVVPPEPASPRGAAAATPAAGTAMAAAPGPNPSLKIDPLLGIVVMEFQDGHGKTSTLPTQRALAAYRRTGLPQHEHAAAQHPQGPQHQTAPATAPAEPPKRAPELATKA